MKPARFEYHAPQTVDDAVALLAEQADEVTGHGHFVDDVTGPARAYELTAAQNSANAST